MVLCPLVANGLFMKLSFNGIVNPFEARLVALDNKGLDYDETFAKVTSIRTVFSIACS